MWDHYFNALFRLSLSNDVTFVIYLCSSLTIPLKVLTHSKLMNNKVIM